MSFNRKGAECYETTGNPILDLFVKQNKNLNKKCKHSQEEFEKLYDELDNAYLYNPELYCKCLLLHRNHKMGNGYKFLFYLGMMVIRCRNMELYKEMLVQSISHGYYKDILRLLKISNMSNLNNTFILPKNMSYTSLKSKTKGNKMRSYIMRKAPIILDNVEDIGNMEVDFEIELYGELVYLSLMNLLNNKFNQKMEMNVDPFLFKYLGNEKGHFCVESELIWNYVEYLFNK